MHRYGNLLRLALIAGVATATLVGCGRMASSNTARFNGTMNGASEVPPNTTPGSGTTEARLDKDNNVFNYYVRYSGLSGPVTAVHFHGPATADANAGVVLTLPDGLPGGKASPLEGKATFIEGKATLTPAQAADLLAGKWYVNVHTAAYPQGEIRGQIVPMNEGRRAALEMPRDALPK